ncbi:MAG: cobalamin-dependent protein [Planctomycetota bacterium]
MQPDLFACLADVVVRLDAAGVGPLVEEALAAGLAPADVLTRGLSAGMRRVGEQFNAGEVFMPEMLVAAEVYLAGLSVVRPRLRAAGTGGDVDSGDPSGSAGGGSAYPLGTMVLGSIHGDIHTVGKMVAIPVFEANGLRVIDLGEDIAADVFVDAIRTHNPRIVGFGTYMMASFMHTRVAVETIARAGLRERVKIICGGPAVDANAARKMGADDASDDAWEAVGKIRRLLARRTA